MTRQRLVLITGASRGIGASIAIESNKLYNESKQNIKSTFLLVARYMSSLENVKAELMKENNGNAVKTIVHDFKEALKVNDMLSILKNAVGDVSYDELYVFYNHGTLKVESVDKIADSATEEFQINVVSVWTLMSALRELFPVKITPIQFHINMSSLLATQITKLLSIYNSTKAARASLFKSIALEIPELRVLNYQPGPVYTKMLGQININRTEICDEDFARNYDEGKLLTTETTVKRMLDIIEKNSFENGATIDYFDEI